MPELELVLVNPKKKSSRLPIWLEATRGSLAKRWLAALKETLRGDHALKKDYCFMGWPESPRDGKFLAAEINRHIETIDAFSKAGGWPVPYSLSERCVPEPSTELLNRLHHHFERLIGQVWDPSPYIQKADAPTAYAIYRLNGLVHEFEHYLDARRRVGEDPSHLDPVLYVTFCKKGIPYVPLEDGDYESFSLENEFGAVHLNYCQLGKTHFDAWSDGDEFVGEQNVNGLRYYSAEFAVRFGTRMRSHEVKDKFAAFGAWLAKNGARLESENSLIDKNGKRHGIGTPIVANMPTKQFGGRSITEIQKLVSDHLDVHAIRVHDDDGVTEAVYDYAYSDAKFRALQLAIMMGFKSSPR